MAIRPTTTGFRDTQEAAFRRAVRSAIRQAPFTKGNRDVILAVVNLWFHHRNGPEKCIHPGREKLAKRANVSVRTVASSLADLRDCGALIPVSHLKGGWGKSTRYTVDLIALFRFCGCSLPEWIPGELAEQNCTHSRPEIAHNMRAEIAHGIYNHVSTFPSQECETGFGAQIIPFRLAGGAV